MEGTENKETPSTNKMLIPAVVVIAVLVLGAAGFLAMKKSRQNQGAAVQPVQTPSPTEVMMKKEQTSAGTSATPSGQAMSDKSVKSFSVSGQNFSFSPSEIRVKKGDSVKVTFTSTSGMHDFVIDAYNVKTSILKNGQSETVTFVADKAGTFEYYCGVGNHRAMGMVGKLIVE